MLRSAVRRRSLVARSDDALARDAAAGGVEAFGELYRRHAPAAWGVAQAILRNSDDASDAVAEAFTKVLKAIVAGGGAAVETLEFRPYLLAATRNAAIDLVRRRSRIEPSERIERAAPTAAFGQPVDHVVAREEEAIVVEAFGRLPERWRTALWLIDVERLSTRDAASVLGVEPNNAAQLAARARARLREQFLQAHVPNHIRPVCEGVVRSLGSYLAGTATATRRIQVEEHVAACAECAERLAHVRDLGIALRRAVLPVPLLLDRRISGSLFRALEAASSVVDRPAASLAAVGGRLPAESWSPMLAHLSSASPAMERLVAGVSAVAFVVGVSTAAVKSNGGPDNRHGTAPVSAGSLAGQTALAPAGFPFSILGWGTTGTGSAEGRPLSGLLGARGRLDGARGAVATQAESKGSPAVPAVLRRVERPLGAVTGLVGPTLRGANLAGVDLRGAVVRGIDFTGADLSGARIVGADLTGALLAGANLTGADLTRSVLVGTDLRGADLRSANLTGADLTGADLRGADLTGADLTSATVATTTIKDARVGGTLLNGTGLELAPAPLPGSAPLLPGAPVIPAPGPGAAPAVGGEVDVPLADTPELPVLAPSRDGAPAPAAGAAGPETAGPGPAVAEVPQASPPVTPNEVGTTAPLGPALPGPVSPVPAPILGGSPLPAPVALPTNAPLSPLGG